MVETCLHDAEAEVRCSALDKVEEVMKEHECTQHKGLDKLPCVDNFNMTCY